MPHRPLVEACVTSEAEALGASRAGADRLELCRDLDAGGLTPGVGLLKAVRARTGIPVFVMVRPDRGGFRATPGQVANMVDEIELTVREGAPGVVLGVLDLHGRVDREALRELVAAASGVPVTFHRAFDEAPDPMVALEAVQRAGVSRILTSGGGGTAWEGRSTLRELVRAAGDEVTILAGGRVRADHVVRLVEVTGVREVHARASAIPGMMAALASEAS